MPPTRWFRSPFSARVRHARRAAARAAARPAPSIALRHARSRSACARALGRHAQPDDAPARFSVPARRPRSCWPPCTQRHEPRAAAHEQRRGAGRAVELVRGDATAGPPASASTAIGQLARRLHRVDVEAARPHCLHERAELRRRGWITPVSLLTAITDTSATSGPSASAQLVGIHACRSAAPARTVSAKPARLECARRRAAREGCSIAVVTRRRRPVAARIAPLQRQVVRLASRSR